MKPLLLLIFIDLYFVSFALNVVHQEKGTWNLPTDFLINVLILNVFLYSMWRLLLWIASKLIRVG